jgi:putative transposase
LKRNFHADAPNMLWLTDITEFGLPQGKVYLSPVIDSMVRSSVEHLAKP